MTRFWGPPLSRLPTLSEIVGTRTCTRSRMNTEGLPTREGMEGSTYPEDDVGRTQRPTVPRTKGNILTGPETDVVVSHADVSP